MCVWKIVWLKCKHWVLKEPSNKTPLLTGWYRLVNWAAVYAHAGFDFLFIFLLLCLHSAEGTRCQWRINHIFWYITLKFFYFLIKIQVAKSGYSRQLDSQFGRSCVERKKKRETISLHDCSGSLFSQPFSVRKVKLYPTCILFRDRKSFVCWWVQWKMHKSTFAIWMTLVICIHLFKERCLWRLSIFT